jgi:hypothetical protein
MSRTYGTVGSAFSLLALFATLLLLTPQELRAEESAAPLEGELVVGGRDTGVDADGGRDAKFEKNRDIPSGLVLEYLELSQAVSNGWWQMKAWDATQLDERFLLRAGFGEKVRLRIGYQSTPYRVGDGARSVLGNGPLDSYGPTYRIGDFIQQTMEDPDGDLTPFFPPPGDPSDNALVQGLASDLLAGTSRFSLGSRRRTGSLGITIQATRHWSFKVDLSHEMRDGTQALGSGTYQRITDVDGDGTTDYDYYFSVRGVELPAVIDYRTTRFDASANYTSKSWFVNIGAGASLFDNRHLGITYDNPFWFNGVNATSGSRRGLWEEGRVSLEPSNEAYNLSLSGGVNLPGRTRITAAVSLGEYRQDEEFLPITTNPATIATADINRDGSTDAQDDPTLAPADIQGIPSRIDGTRTIGSNLDAESDTMAIDFAVTSRPIRNLTLTGRYRSYEYEGQEGIQVVPARTEYIESQVKLDFKNDLILHVPPDFTRETYGVEAAYRFAPWLKVKGFAKRKSYDYDRYEDPDGNVSRDSGSRAVEATDDDIYGITARFAASDWLSGRLTAQSADREYEGDYTVGFSGELETVRQYDIANRERDAAHLQLDFMLTDAFTVGVGYSMYDDEYPDSEFGLQEGETTALNLNLNYAADNGVNVFFYADRSEWDADMHLRTKCSNCAPPAGFAPWDVPNYDWMSEYKDGTLAFGGGVSFKAGSRSWIEILANYVSAEVEQSTRNPDTPTELDPNNPRVGEVANVAVGYDFPDQENTILSTEIRLRHRISDRLTAGLWWLYESFDLDDFQWDDLEPYGDDFLSVDDATRFLVLDSRYREYSAHVIQVFVEVSL